MEAEVAVMVPHAVSSMNKQKLERNKERVLKREKRVGVEREARVS